MSAETTRPAMGLADSMRVSLAGSKTPVPTRLAAILMDGSSGRDQTSPPAIRATAPIGDPQAGIEASDPTMGITTPIRPPSGRSQTGRGQSPREARIRIASATSIPGGHRPADAHSGSAAGEQDQPTAIPRSTPSGEPPSAADDPRTAIDPAMPLSLAPSGGTEQGPPVPRDRTVPIRVSALADPFLALAADVLDDLEKVRIANENRLRQLTRTETDADGEERGFGLTEDHPDVARLAALVDALGKAEHQATLNLQRIMRRHPLGPWVKATAGVGEKQAARLLASIGDPYWNTLHDRPRTVSELWAYTGYHVLPARHDDNATQSAVAGGSKTGHPDQGGTEAQVADVGVAPKRQRGARANWSSAAKMRAYLIAESCIKQRTSPFRPVYDDARAKYADAVHAVPCHRCGPSGKPAPSGSPLSDGHKHARAMRAVSKALLKALWLEARRIHEQPGGQGCRDAQTSTVAGRKFQED